MAFITSSALNGQSPSSQSHHFIATNMHQLQTYPFVYYLCRFRTQTMAKTEASKTCPLKYGFMSLEHSANINTQPADGSHCPLRVVWSDEHSVYRLQPRLNEASSVVHIGKVDEVWRVHLCTRYCYQYYQIQIDAGCDNVLTVLFIASYWNMFSMWRNRRL